MVSGAVAGPQKTENKTKQQTLCHIAKAAEKIKMVKAEINDIENKNTMKKIIKAKSWFY